MRVKTGSLIVAKATYIVMGDFASHWLSSSFTTKSPHVVFCVLHVISQPIPDQVPWWSYMTDKGLLNITRFAEVLIPKRHDPLSLV